MNFNLLLLLLLLLLTVLLFWGLNAIVDTVEADGTIQGYRAVFVGIGVAILTALSIPIAPLEILAQQVTLAVTATIIMVAGEFRRQRKTIRERKEHWEAEMKRMGDYDD